MSPTPESDGNDVPADHDQVFYVSITADYALTVDDVWPDGDAPGNPTSGNVRELLRAGGDKFRVLSDWGMDDFDVDVDGERVWT